MTERSRFWTTSGSGDNDTIIRDVWWDIWESVLGSLVDSVHQGGLLHGSGDGTNPPLFVEESAVPAATVKVNIGRATVKGAWYDNDAAETVAIAANTDGSGFARIDYLILRKDVVAQTVRLVNLLGTPSGSPVAPTLTQTAGVTWEIPIAQIAVANLFTTIVDANITYDRPNGIGGYAIKRSAEEGGTGINTYALGDIPYAGSVDPESLSVVNPIADGHIIIGNGATLEALDHRVDVIQYREANGVNGETYTTGAFRTVSLNNLQDSTGYWTVAASQMNCEEAGDYEFFNIGTEQALAGGTPQVRYRLYNVTQASVIAIGKADLDGSLGGRPWIGSAKSTSVALNDKIELQVKTTVNFSGGGHVGGADATLAEVYAQVCVKRVG